MRAMQVVKKCKVTGGFTCAFLIWSPSGLIKEESIIHDQEKSCVAFLWCKVVAIVAQLNTYSWEG